jgi:hypothetical protein
MEQTDDRQPAENGLVRAYPWLALLTAIVILIQAFMAGRFLYGLSDLMEEHGWVGNLTFLLVIALVVAAWLGRPSGRTTNTELVLGIVLLVLVAAQFGLGYSDSTSASALHVANGVLVMAITAAITAFAFARQSARG